MNGVKKIDYRELSGKNIMDNEEEQEEQVAGRQKRFSLGALNTFWLTADKKVKIELVAFIIIALMTIGAFVVYFIQRPPKAPASFNEAGFSEEDTMFMNEEAF